MVDFSPAETEARMKAFIQDGDLMERLELPGTTATTKAAFKTLRRWILEARAAEKAHAAGLEDQAIYWVFPSE